MKLLKEYLKLWKETSDGDCIPISLTDLCNGIKSINPTDNYIDIKKKLCRDGYIEVIGSSKYVLTDLGLSFWKDLPHVKQKAFSKSSTGKEWVNFRNLLSYYIECEKLEETPTHVFYDDNVNKDYYIPKKVPFNWLKKLGSSNIDEELNIEYELENQYIINKFKTHYDDNNVVFIGYPIIATKTRNGNLRYVPVGVIPVDIKLSPSSLTTNSSNTLTLIPDFFQAKINHAMLNLYFTENKEKSFLNMVNNTHLNDEYVNLFDLHNSLNIIETALSKKNNDDEKLDPVMPSQFIPSSLRVGERRLCNTVVIYNERDFKYSKVLIKELQHIKNDVPDKELDNTSLAYIYRNPKLEKTHSSSKLGISFVQSNSEQLESLEQAINNPCCKITGPPGTGKSQVATNIIANSIYYNESILFTSKNHKAVSAIRKRSETLFNDVNDNIYLTDFCHDATEQMSNPWYRKDIRSSISTSITYPVNIENSAQLQRSIEILLHYKKLIQKEEISSDKYFEALDSFNKSKTIILNEVLSENSELELTQNDIDKLKINSSKLKTMNTSLFGKLIWKYRDNKIVDEAIQNIKSLVPNLYNIKLNDLETLEIKKIINTIIEDYDQYNNNQKLLDDKVLILKETAIDNSIIRKMIQQYKQLEDNKFDGYCYNQNNRLKPYEENENLLDFIHSVEGKYKNKNSVGVIVTNSKAKTSDDAVFFNHFLKIHPSWAVTLLSLQYSSPCLPGLFDRVIIDEAAQCDCISIIPALFRAKSVVVMGDRQQLPPIFNIGVKRDEYFWNKFNLNGQENYNYLNATAFSIVPSKEIKLKEHFRCAPEIAEIFDDYFYGNELRTRTDVSKLNFPKNCGYTHAVEWIDIKNSFNDEIDSTINHVTLLLNNDYKGTIGIISPLKIVVNTIQEKLESLNVNPEQVISKTVASFQGNECDIIIFVVAYNNQILTSKGKRWYITDKSNQYIYNVAISRAKALLILVGDREACRNSNIKILEKLANSPKPIKTILDSDTPIFESPWEKNLYDALERAGIHTKTQVPLVGRRLDLAYISDNFKLDIEIDGVQYHTTKSGTRKMDDVFRDMQVESAGWFVIRFWVFKLQKNMDECVEEIKKMIELKGYSEFVYKNKIDKNSL